MALDAARLVKIYRIEPDDNCFGSGYLVTPDLVLTAAHVCGSGKIGDSCEVRFLDPDETQPWLYAQIVWRRDEHDIALLRVRDARWRPPGVAITRWGKVMSVTGLPCRAAGFPAAQAVDEARYSELVEGTVNSLTKSERHRYDITVTSGVPDSDTGESLWAGMSGAALFVGDFLVGVVVIKTAHYAERLTAVPIAEAFADDTFVELMTAVGSSVYIDEARVTELPYSTMIDAFFAAMIGTKAEPVPFGGREAELATLDRWLGSAEAQPRILLTADAGAGKSSLLAHWVRGLSGRFAGVRVVFLPVNIGYEVSTREEVFTALAARVARAYGDAQPMTGSYPELRERLASLLSRPPPMGRSVLVVLDGLDETTGWRPGSQLIPRNLGSGVRVVLSARPVHDLPDARAWTKLLGWADTETAVISIGPLSLSAIESLVQAQNQDVDTKLVATELHRITAGDPILLRLLIDDLRRAVTPSAWVPQLEVLSPGLKAYFDRWWAEQRERWQVAGGVRPSDVAIVLDLLALAHGPLKRADLLSLARRFQKMTGDDLDDVLQALRRFVVPVDSSGFVIAHPLFAVHRKERLRTDGDLSERADAFRAWGREVIGMLRSGELLPADVSRYLVRHLGDHLADAQAPVQELFDLVHPAWRAAWDAATTEISGHLLDVRRAAAAAARADADALAEGQSARWLPERLACLAEIADSDDSSGLFLLSGELVAELVRHRLWNRRRALAYLRGIADLDLRATAFGAVASALDLDADAALLDLLDSVRNAPSLERSDAVIGYLRFLLSTERTAEALQAIPVLAVKNRKLLLKALAMLWPYEPSAVREMLQALAPDVPPAALLTWLCSPMDREDAARLLERDPAAALDEGFDSYAVPEYHTFPTVAPWLTPQDRERRVSSILNRLTPELDHDTLYRWVTMLPKFVTRSQAPQLLEATGLLDRIRYRITRLQIGAQVLPLLESDQRATTERAIREAGADVFEDSGHVERAAIVDALVRSGLINHVLETLPVEEWDEETTAVMATSMETDVLVRTATKARSGYRYRGPWVAGRLLARLAARSFDDAVNALALAREPPIDTPAGKAAAAVLRSLDTGHPDSSLYTLNPLTLRSAAWSAVAATVPISGRQATEAISAQWGPWAASTFTGIVESVPPEELPDLYRVAVSLLHEWGVLAFDAIITYFGLLTAAGHPVVEVAIKESDLLSLALSLIADPAHTQSDQIINKVREFNTWSKVAVWVALLRRPDANQDMLWSSIEKAIVASNPGSLGYLYARLLITVAPSYCSTQVASMLFKANDRRFEDMWTNRVRAIAPALGQEQIANVLTEVEDLESGTNRSALRASIAARLGILGSKDDCERFMTMSREEFVEPALIEMRAALPIDQMPWWFELVRRQLSGRLRAERRAYVLSHGARLWNDFDKGTTGDLLAGWIDGQSPQSREVLLTDLISYAPGLIRAGTPDTVGRIIKHLGLWS